MKFLYPEFLFGLFTLIIPIIIHLFNFRRSKKVYFSSTRFLKNIKKSTSQKRQIKHFLILFSRLLFLTFLVLAFAQPFIPSTDKNPQAKAATVAVRGLKVYTYISTTQPACPIVQMAQRPAWISALTTCRKFWISTQQTPITSLSPTNLLLFQTHWKAKVKLRSWSPRSA